MASSPAAPVRSPRIQTPALPCSPPTYRRRGFLLPATRPSAPRPADADPPGDRTPAMMCSRASVLGQRQPERCTAIEMPSLHRINPVPVRRLARLQKKIDSAGTGAAIYRATVAEGLAEPTTLGMRPKIQVANNAFCVVAHVCLSGSLKWSRTGQSRAGTLATARCSVRGVVSLANLRQINTRRRRF